MAYTRKTYDDYQIHVNYGDGYEHECSYGTLKEAREDLKRYRENCRYPSMIVKKRIKL